MRLNYFLLIIFSLFLLSSVGAIGWPHQFYGTVTVNGAAANGASVVAKINGTQYGSTLSVNGTYGISPNLFFVNNPELTGSPTIQFYLNGSMVAEQTFIANNLTELNLSIGVAPFCGDSLCNGTETCETCPAECGACNTGDPGNPGGGSPGGGGGSGGLNVSFSEKCINKDINVLITITGDRPATNASVKILDGDKTLAEGNTGDTGIFAFSLTTAKEFKLEARKPGYVTKRVTFSLADCNAGEIPLSDENNTEEELNEGQTLSCENVNCNDLNPCTKDSCETGVCNYTMLEGKFCGIKGTCSALGECVLPQTVKDNNPPVPTGFFGLTGLQQTLGIIIGIVVILGIVFVVIKKQ